MPIYSYFAHLHGIRLLQKVHPYIAIGLDLPKGTIEDDFILNEGIQLNVMVAPIEEKKEVSECMQFPMRAWHDEHKPLIAKNCNQINAERPLTVAKPKAISPIKAMPMDLQKPYTACGKKDNIQKEPSDHAFIIK